MEIQFLFFDINPYMSPSASFHVLTSIFKNNFSWACENQSKALLFVEDKIFDLLNVVWQQRDDPVSACHEEDLLSSKNLRFCLEELI